MQAKERILHANNYMLLSHESGKTKWQVKSILVTEYSLMAFDNYDNLFSSSDIKILFYRNDCFYVPRSDFIQKSDMEDKEQVGCLHNDYKYIIILVSYQKNTFYLMGSKTEEQAKTLTKSVQLANRFQEMMIMSHELKTTVNSSYLNWMVQSCNIGLKFFEVKPAMMTSSKSFQLLRHFVKQSELVEHLSFKNFEMTKEQIEKITALIVTLPQTQVKSFRFLRCNFTDDNLPDIGRAIKHNGYLEFLKIESCNITDKSLRFFAGLWQYVPFLEYFSLTHCPGVKAEIYFSSFLEKIVVDLQLVELDLSHNSLTEKISTFLIDELFTVKNLPLKTLNLSYNDFTPHENWKVYQIFIQSTIHETCDLIMEPYPINIQYFDRISKSQKSTTLELLRGDIKKRQFKRMLLSKQEISKCKEVKEELNLSILAKKPLEQLFNLCKTIHDLEHSFPVQYVENATLYMRETMIQAESLEDYYSFYHAKEGALMIGMNRKDIEPKANVMKNTTDIFTQKLTRIFSFQIPENQINSDLEKLIDIAMKRDYRGDAIDLLLYLKHKRDEKVNELITRNIDSNYIELKLMQKDPFYILKNDEDFKANCKKLVTAGITVETIISLHQAWVDYEKVSQITKDKLTLMVEEFDYTLERLMDKLEKTRFERTKFMLADSDTHEFDICEQDILLRISKTVCIYRHYKGKYIQDNKSIVQKAKQYVLSSALNPDGPEVSDIVSRVLDSEDHSIFDLSPTTSIKDKDTTKKGTKSLTGGTKDGQDKVGEDEEDEGTPLKRSAEADSEDDFGDNSKKKGKGEDSISVSVKTPKGKGKKRMSVFTENQEESAAGDVEDTAKSDNMGESGRGGRKTPKMKRRKRPPPLKDPEDLERMVKLPFSISATDYKTGLRINGYIFKICRLDFEMNRTTMINYIKQFLIYTRGGKRIDFKHLMLDEAYVIGEIFLGIIRFIYRYKDSISKQLVINGVNLIAFMSYYFKMTPDLAKYILKKFYNLNYSHLSQIDAFRNNLKVTRQCSLFMSNLMDKLETEKFLDGKGFEMPSEEKIVELFEGPPVNITLEVMVIAKKAIQSRFECLESKPVHEFIKEMQQADHLFEGLEVSSSSFWLFVHCDQLGFQDLPLEFCWTMRRVRHLLEWLKSFSKTDKFYLVYKPRIWTIRYRLSFDRFSKSKIDGMFYQIKRDHLIKNVYKNFCKLDKLVKISGVLSFINDIENNRNSQFVKSGILMVTSSVPESSQTMLEESEWIRRVEEYRNKESQLKKLSLFSLKKKFLSFFLDSPCFCSSIYSYEVKNSPKSLLNCPGELSINIYGVNFFENDDFEKPKLSIPLEKIFNLKFLGDYLLLEYTVGETQKKIPMKIYSVVKEDIAYDIISYMLISMREDKRLFYAYNFISKYFLPGLHNHKHLRNSAIEPTINRCKDEIARQRYHDVNLEGLAHTFNYSQTIAEEAHLAEFNSINQSNRDAFSRQRQMTLEERGSSSPRGGVLRFGRDAANSFSKGDWSSRIFSTPRDRIGGGGRGASRMGALINSMRLVSGSKLSFGKKNAESEVFGESSEMPKFSDGEEEDGDGEEESVFKSYGRLSIGVPKLPLHNFEKKKPEPRKSKAMRMEMLKGDEGMQKLFQSLQPSQIP